MPLITPISKMTETMYKTKPSHKVAGICTGALLASSKEKKDPAFVGWRPAGPAAMTRMAAASLYLNACAGAQWCRASEAWAGALLGKGAVFQRGEEYFLSLGFNTWVALALKLQPQVDGDTTYLHLPAKPPPTATVGGASAPDEFEVLVNHDVTNESEFRGLHTEFCLPHLSPPRLVDSGLLWRVTSAPVALVPFAVLHRTWLSSESLQAVCRALGLPVHRSGKSFNKKDFAFAIVAHFFGEETWETRMALLYEWLAVGPFPEKAYNTCSDMVINLLDEANKDDFVDKSGGGGYELDPSKDDDAARKRTSKKKQAQEPGAEHRHKT